MPPERSPAPTLRAAVEQWLAFRSRSWTSAATRKNFEGIASEWISCLGDLPVDSVRPAQVQQLYLVVDNGKRSGSWVNKVRNTLHAFFGWAVGLEIVPTNPVTAPAWPRKDERKHKSARSRVRLLITPDILSRIIDTVPIRYHRLLCFLFLSGLRIGEALASRWSWIQRDQRDRELWVLCVPDATRKTRVGYTVPLGERAMAVLGPRRGDEERIFFEAPTNSGAVRHELQRAGQRIGVLRLSPHQFRRSCATALANLGAPLPAIQRYLGWRSAPAEWLEMFNESYYLGIESGRLREIQDRLRK